MLRDSLTTRPRHPSQFNGPAFLSAVVSLVVSFAAAAAPIPLYNINRGEDGFTSAGISMAVVGYAVGTIGALLVLGRLSNHLGRRLTAIASLGLLLLGCLLLLNVHDIGTLLAGRLLVGIGTGLASSSLTSYIVDAAPSRPEWLASVAFKTAGLLKSRETMMSSDRSDIAQALWYVGPGRAELREEMLLPPPTGSVCVRALHGALSRGTESLIFSGRVPKSEFDRMRAPFMAGAFSFPVKYGYSVVGRIETGPRELCGRIVFALHPHQTRLIIPGSAAMPLPESLTPARAVARRQHGDRTQRRVGRQPRKRRSHRDRWSGCRRRFGRLPLSADNSRCPCDARRYQSCP